MKCPKCSRTLHPWPLKRPGTCSPKSWVNCIRNDRRTLDIVEVQRTQYAIERKMQPQLRTTED